MPKRWATAILVIFIFVGQQGSAAESSPPPPPPDTVMPVEKTNARVICVNCGDPFDSRTHNVLIGDLVDKPYVAELRKALYQQDILHQFESKAHFDNCDFEAAGNYIDSLLEEAEQHVNAAIEAKSDSDEEKMINAASRAFFAIGQALHGVQDFYAHTNYVELQAQMVKRVNDIEIIAPWRSAGRERIRKLQKVGLISGYVFWGTPKRCPNGTPSHSDLAKDNAKTKSGAIIIPHLQNNSQYQLAVILARATSAELISDLFKRWPLLRELNGEYVAFETLVDRRGID